MKKSQTSRDPAEKSPKPEREENDEMSRFLNGLERHRRGGNAHKLLKYLEENPDKHICDDCLSDKTRVKNRRQVNQIANRLGNEGRIKRRFGLNCSICLREKKTSSYKPNGCEDNERIAEK